MITRRVSFFVPIGLCGKTSLRLLLNKALQGPCAVLCLTVVTIFILLFRSVKGGSVSLSPFRGITCVFVTVSKLTVKRCVLELALRSISGFNSSSFSTELSLISLFFVVLFLMLVLCVCRLNCSGRRGVQLLRRRRVCRLREARFGDLSRAARQLQGVGRSVRVCISTVGMLTGSGG